MKKLFILCVLLSLLVSCAKKNSGDEAKENQRTGKKTNQTIRDITMNRYSSLQQLSERGIRFEKSDGRLYLVCFKVTSFDIWNKVNELEEFKNKIEYYYEGQKVQIHAEKIKTEELVSLIEKSLKVLAESDQYSPDCPQKNLSYLKL